MTCDGQASANRTASSSDPVNPFSSQCVRPGAMDYLFRPGPRMEQLLDRFRDTGSLGQIVGPHGSGKSTLVLSLLPLLQRAGYCPVLFSLHDGQRRLPRGWRQQVDRQPAGQRMIIVDGYEQLGRLARWNLHQVCAAREWALLVTSHASVGLPLLYRTSTSLELAESVVRQLLEGRPHRIDSESIRSAFDRHHGNLRSVLFELYDLYEQQRD